MIAFRPVLIEALLVGAGAVAVALAANVLSPRGLTLGRDYFPPVVTSAPAAAAPPAAGAPAGEATAVRQRLAQRGLNVASLAEVSAWHREASRGAAVVAFIDARSEAHYATGHIPAAWPFDHYRPERSLPMVLPVCLGAEKVVVYCAGGACEDSEFAAVMLREAGVPRERLFVFPGGLAEWTAGRLPLESGARGSGAIRP